MSAQDEDCETMPKQRKLSSSGEEQSSALDLSSCPSALSFIHLKEDINLNLIKFFSILRDEPTEKSIFILGEYSNQKVIVILEKTPFNVTTVKQILTSTDKSLTKHFSNDIYGSYTAYPPSEINPIKVTIIHPATEKHIQKYSSQIYHSFQETYQDYRNITLPIIEAKKFSLNWIQSILNHESEEDRIVFEDTSEENGFILIPDLKWDTTQIEDLHLTAICRRKDLISLRSLNHEHLPLLENIKLKSLKAIESKYDLDASKISNVNRAHMLDSIIENIKLVNDYYQRATLTLLVSENDELYEKFKAKNSS